MTVFPLVESASQGELSDAVQAGPLTMNVFAAGLAPPSTAENASVDGATVSAGVDREGDRDVLVCDALATVTSAVYVPAARLPSAGVTVTRVAAAGDRQPGDVLGRGPAWDR